MSLRTILCKICVQGRTLFFPGPWRFPRPYLQVGRKIAVGSIKGQPAHQVNQSANKSALQSHFENARKLFANSILSHVTPNVSSSLRERTTKQLLFGNATPFFAFVGISLASGSIIRKEDELEGLCWEIRDSLERMHRSLGVAESDLFKPNEEININKFTIGPYIGKGSNAAIYAARKSLNSETNEGPENASSEPVKNFPFALKMVFNYSIESLASAIMIKTFREMVPAQIRYTPVNPEDGIFREETVTLPPHPNLVTMHCAFPDRVPENLPETSEFPNALPSRINPSGFGRNMSLFILMKRYDMNLAQYLEKEQKLETREAVLLFAQILEAVAHINRHGVAHRDMKSDNFLVDFNHEAEEKECPTLVLSDFGCCLADPLNGLFMPIGTQFVDKGGNTALMAPEVATARADNISVAASILNRMSYIDYRKSDGWAAGAIAYELFTGLNPFYRIPNSAQPSLLNTTYTESQLPPLDDVPAVVVKVVKSLLIRNPNNRISADFAADVIQLYLWAPTAWLKSYIDQPLPSNTEIMQWLLCMTTKILTTTSFGRRRSQAEYQLIGSFLRRVKLATLRSAIAFARTA